MLSSVMEVRQKYQFELHCNGVICHKEYDRSLTSHEMTDLHNAYMNDVSAWMSPECLKTYRELNQAADELDKGWSKGKKGEHSAGKPVRKGGSKGVGKKGEYSAGKPVQKGKWGASSWPEAAGPTVEEATVQQDHQQRGGQQSLLHGLG